MAEATGDAAFLELFERHRGDLRGVAGKALRGCGPDELDDLLQDVFLKGLTAFRAGGLRDAASFRAWILSVAWNAAVDRQRRKARTDRRFVDEGRAPPETWRVPAGSDPGSLLLDRERLRTAIEALDAVPIGAARLVVRLWLEGLGAEAIGLRLGMRRSTVSSHLKRSIARIRARFRERHASDASLITPP